MRVSAQFSGPSTTEVVQAALGWGCRDSSCWILSCHSVGVAVAAFTGRVVYIGYAKEAVAYETRLLVLLVLLLRFGALVQ